MAIQSKFSPILIWLLAILFTLTIAIYQRMTGPTYPIRGKMKIEKQEIKYRLIRTYDGADGASIDISVPDTSIKGEIAFRRFNSNDPWTLQPMLRKGSFLTGKLPHLPPAGKMMYKVTLIRGNVHVSLNEKPAVLRYKGQVPAYALYPHIFFIFLAMLFSTLTGMMAIAQSKKTYRYAWLTVITLLLGGLIMGPVVQKFSFGAFWTGWPFGHDLTDNKSLLAFLFWAIALSVLHKNRYNRTWPILASVILLMVFLIPHSVLGSEIDFTQETQTQTTH